MRMLGDFLSVLLSDSVLMALERKPYLAPAAWLMLSLAEFLFCGLFCLIPVFWCVLWIVSIARDDEASRRTCSKTAKVCAAICGIGGLIMTFFVLLALGGGRA